MAGVAEEAGARDEDPWPLADPGYVAEAAAAADVKHRERLPASTSLRLDYDLACRQPGDPSAQDDAAAGTDGRRCPQARARQALNVTGEGVVQLWVTAGAAVVDDVDREAP